MSGMTLPRVLSDWTDIDFAAHALARALGLVPVQSNMSDAKWVYWSDNPLGNALVALLDRLVLLGFLEKRGEPDIQYRVIKDFRRNLDIEKIWTKAYPPSLNLIVFRCADLDRSKHFYETLGLAFKAEQHDVGPRHYSTLVGETILELYPAATGSASPIRSGFSIANLDAAIAALRSLGDSVLSYNTSDSPARALVRDPDGNKIELTAAAE